MIANSKSDTHHAEGQEKEGEGEVEAMFQLLSEGKEIILLYV
jgi:hypothetical protein